MSMKLVAEITVNGVKLEVFSHDDNDYSLKKNGEKTDDGLMKGEEAFGRSFSIISGEVRESQRLGFH